MRRQDLLGHFQLIPKHRVREEYRQMEKDKTGENDWPRPPTLGLRLALSSFGRPAKEGSIPLAFFARKDIQIYLGFPFHPLQKIFHFSGHTTSRKIVETVFPDFLKRQLPSDIRYKPIRGLPSELDPWLKAVTAIVKKLQKGIWVPPPICILDFKCDESSSWIVRTEHLCGQVPDGTHRVLAYTMVGIDFPEKKVPVRLLEIRPAALAAVNIATISLRLMMDPLRTPSYIKKRFKVDALFVSNP